MLVSDALEVERGPLDWAALRCEKCPVPWELAHRGVPAVRGRVAVQGEVTLSPKQLRPLPPVLIEVTKSQLEDAVLAQSYLA